MTKPVENLPPTPDILGSSGRAWRYDLAAIERITGGKPHASLLGWLIEARWAHPLWHSYDLCLYHLRDVPGLGPAKIYVPGATHELMLFALDPAKPRDIRNLPNWLHPANFAAQIVEKDDAAAIARVNHTVIEIANGQLNPDTDHRQSWIMRFGAGMIRGNAKTSGETKIIISSGKESVEIVHPPAPPQAPMS